MPKRHPNHRLVKTHYTYAVGDIAQLFKVHKNTVREWLRSGLKTIDQNHPMLIHGDDLAGFLKKRRQEKKRPCQPGEIFCVRCRTGKLPAGNMADYIPINGTFGNLEGICPDCGGMIYRRASLARLEQFREKLEIRFKEEGRRVSDSAGPTVNSQY